MQFEVLAEGYHFEGMYPDGDTLWFSDVFDEGVRRLLANGHVDIWLPERRMIGGILLNMDGKVLCSGIGGIAWVDPVTGSAGMLLESINGNPIRGVNEMIPDGHGGIYFGTLDMLAQERRETMHPGGLYHLDYAGGVSLLYDGIGFPNGIGLSIDGRQLYNNATSVGTFAYDLAVDGSARARRLLLEKPDCDGLALDMKGAVWVCGYNSSELLCLAPDGSVCRKLETPAFGVSNLRFGGINFGDLYITATCPEVMAAYQSGKPLPKRGSKILRAKSSVIGLPITRTKFSIS